MATWMLRECRAGCLESCDLRRVPSEPRGCLQCLHARHPCTRSFFKTQGSCRERHAWCRQQSTMERGSAQSPVRWRIRLLQAPASSVKKVVEAPRALECSHLRCTVQELRLGDFGVLLASMCNDTAEYRSIEQRDVSFSSSKLGQMLVPGSEPDAICKRRRPQAAMRTARSKGTAALNCGSAEAWASMGLHTPSARYPQTSHL